MQYGTNLQANKYLSKESDFSGVVLFYSVLDEFVNGWKYENGSITGKILESIPSKGSMKMAPALKKTLEWRLFVIETCWYQMVMTKNHSWIFLGCDFNGYQYIYTGGGGNTGWYYPATGGGGGGSGTNNPGQLIPALAARFPGGTTNLSPDDIDNLNTAFLQMNAKCIYSQITNYLQTNNITLGSISIDETMVGVASISPSGNLKFGSSQFITEEYLSHEWFHLGQKHMFGINVNAWQNLGMAEFENRLLADIYETIRLGGNFAYTNHNFACYHIGSPTTRVPYQNWLNSITSNGTQYPTSVSISQTEFDYWANVFGDVTTNSVYNKSNLVLYNYNAYYPITLTTLFENCNNNN